MSRSRVRSIARGVLAGLLCPVAASAAIFVGISLVMSIAYLSSRGAAPSAAALRHASDASLFLQRCGPILSAIAAAVASFRARDRFVERALSVGLAATLLGVAVGLAFGEPNWTAGAALAATVVPLVGATLGAALAALRELKLGERARAVADLEAATWRHEVFGVLLGLAGADGVARISLVDVEHEPRTLAAWPDGEALLGPRDIAAIAARLRTGSSRARGVVVFRSGSRVGGKIVLAIELADPRARLGRAEMIAAITDDALLAHARVARLERARDAALERERRRVADTVHDTLAQDLTHTVRALEAVERRMPAADPALFGALESARRGLAGARSLIAASTPGGDGAAPAWTSLGARVRAAVGDVARGLDAEVRVRVEGSPLPLAADAEDLLVRAAREGVNNAKKHARASRIMVTLTYAGNLARLDVCDDGVGFAFADARDGASGPGERVGIKSLRQAARGLGASVELESEPGLGASLVVAVSRHDAARVA